MSSMEKKQFRVEATSRARTIYVVEAEDLDEARRLAAERWQGGEPGDIAGFEWEELSHLNVANTMDSSGQRQDDELVLRFIAERERLLARLGETTAGFGFNDAISAVQLALDLGWYVQDSAGAPVPNSVRAAEALERLCDQRRVVSFQRTRVRSGERGEILLYCTPEYLERLSASLDEDPELRTAVG